MESAVHQKLKIEGMSCGHCVKTVTRIIEESGASNVNVTLEGGTAEFDVANDKIPAIIKEINDTDTYKAIAI